MRLVRVKAFSENISGKYFIFWKCYFPERKMCRNSFYGKSIPMFSSYKHFTKNDFRFTENHFRCLFPSNILRKMKFIFLQKIISHVWFVDHFTKNNNFKHLHYLNKPVTIHKYSSKFKHLHCLNTSITVQKYSSTSTSKIIIWIYP